jgi:hypothetical protein
MSGDIVWELWDVASGNIINTYPTERAALAVVREAGLRPGRQYVEHWALGSDVGDVNPERVIEGDALFEKAMTAFAIPG